MRRIDAAAVGLLALAACQATVDGESGGFDAARAYARLTTMAGTYEVEFPGEPERSKVIWENVSGGHAVMEKLNVGTPHEMVSLYYLEGEELALTHYCAAGNRPLMRLDRARSTRDELFFDFDPATTGIDPKVDGHIHSAHFLWLDADSVDVTWSFWAEGAEQHVKLFQLRKKVAEAEAAAPAVANPATTPVARADDGWQARHAAMNEQVKQGGAELLFIGDSITQGWEGEGAALWQERYAPRKAVNLGISGDQTEHVLWRLQNGNLEGIAPKAAVIMIGTNNVGNTGGTQSAEQIAGGVKAIVAELATRTPTTKVLLLAIFPRAAPGDPKRDTIAAINAELARLADAERVTFLDLGTKFLSADGTLAPEVMPDQVHLSAKGYAIWADAIEGELKRLLGEK